MKHKTAGLLLAAFAATPAAAVPIADLAGDYIDASTVPVGWEYLESDMLTGGTEMALLSDLPVGNETAVGFGTNTFPTTGGFNIGAIVGDNADGGDYEIFTDGQIDNVTPAPGNHSAVPGVDLLFHPGGLGIDAGPEFVMARRTITQGEIDANGGFVAISGAYSSLLGEDDGNSPSIYVLHNDTDLLAGAGIDSHSGTLDISGVSVVAGDTIAFVVGSGANLFGDETAISAVIDLSNDPGNDPADLDNDGDVDDADFGLFFAAFSGPGVPTGNPAADLDGDTDTDDADFGLAFAAFTGPGVAASVPEPTSLALMGLGGLLIACRRRA